VCIVSDPEVWKHASTPLFLYLTYHSDVSSFPNRLRCDRSLPACGNCISRSEAESCDYSKTKNYPQIADQSAPRSHAGRDPPTPEPSETPSDTNSSLDASDVREEQKVSEKLRQKLERLELLIGDLMENHPTCSSHKECKSKHKEAESGQRGGGEESSELASSSHNVPRFNSRGGESMWSTLLTEVRRTPSPTQPFPSSREVCRRELNRYRK
jgi:hypothetical protein